MGNSKSNEPKHKALYAWEYLEYGENKEGYWTMARFLAQLKRAVEIAEIGYPREQGWRICLVFDNSSCHNAMAEDALNVNNMNVKPGENTQRHCL